MRNITVSIDDEVYRQARVWAAQRCVSVSKVVAELLRILPSHPAANRRFPAPSPPPATDHRPLTPDP